MTVLDKIDQYLVERDDENAFRKLLKQKNKEGRKLRLKVNPKSTGVKDKYYLTGKDIKGRAVNMKGSEDFIRHAFKQGHI